MNALHIVAASVIATAALMGPGGAAPAAAVEPHVYKVAVPDGHVAWGGGRFKEGRAVVEFKTPQGWRHGVINRYGYFIVPPMDARMFRYADGLLRIQRRGRPPTEYLDRNGRPVLKVPYEWVGEFSGGVAVFTPGAPLQAWVRYGLIDKTGREVVPAKYDIIWPNFHEGSTVVKLGDKFGTIDRHGKPVIPIEYDWVQYAYEGLWNVRKGDESWFVTASGARAFPRMYWGGFFGGGYAVVGLRKGGDEVVILDRQGQEHTPAHQDLYQFAEGLVSFRKKDKQGFLRGDGSVAIPARFDTAYTFHEGLCNVQLDGKWGYVDAQGHMAIPARFDSASEFSEGLASVSEGGRAFYIDKRGNVAIDVGRDAGTRFGAY